MWKGLSLSNDVVATVFAPGDLISDSLALVESNVSLLALASLGAPGEAWTEIAERPALSKFLRGRTTDWQPPCFYCSEQ